MTLLFHIFPRCAFVKQQINVLGAVGIYSINAGFQLNIRGNS